MTVTDAAPSPPRRTARELTMLAGPIVPAILRPAAPNAISIAALTLAVGVETVFVGALGPAALAANAHVFPFLVLMQTMSTGARSGGIAAVCWAITVAMIANGLLAGAMLVFRRWGGPLQPSHPTPSQLTKHSVRAN